MSFSNIQGAHGRHVHRHTSGDAAYSYLFQALNGERIDVCIANSENLVRFYLECVHPFGNTDGFIDALSGTFYKKSTTRELERLDYALKALRFADSLMGNVVIGLPEARRIMVMVGQVDEDSELRDNEKVKGLVKSIMISYAKVEERSKKEEKQHKEGYGKNSKDNFPEQNQRNAENHYDRENKKMKNFQQIHEENERSQENIKMRFNKQMGEKRVEDLEDDQRKLRTELRHNSRRKKV
ncbi:MAG: hypothetical protein LBG86_00815 [Puniceicoccales bacterium]|jgi:hypothetical protein|nr:hypothetical protein [Puniceicoccales bacterium]